VRLNHCFLPIFDKIMYKYFFSQSLIIVVSLSIFLGGCESKQEQEKLETIQGLQEKVQVQDEASKQQNEQHQQEITLLKEAHRKECASYEKKIAELTDKNTTLEQENVLYKECIDSGEYISDANISRKQNIAYGLVIVLLGFAVFTCIIAYKWWALRNHYRTLFTQIVALKSIDELNL
jgi:hypothetical protein